MIQSGFSKNESIHLAIQAVMKNVIRFDSWFKQKSFDSDSIHDSNQKSFTSLLGTNGKTSPMELAQVDFQRKSQFVTNSDFTFKSQPSDRPEAALLGALRIRRLRFKAALGLFSRNWGQNGAQCPKWRFATNVAHCDEYGAIISGVLTYITLPSLVRIGTHLPKLWSFEVFDPSWHVPRGRWRRFMGTCLWPVDVIITMWNMVCVDTTFGDLWPAKDAKCVKYRIFT